MWKSSARELAAWKAAWSITLRLCEHGWSTTYKAKGCSNFGFVEANCGTWTADSHQVSGLIPGDLPVVYRSMVKRTEPENEKPALVTARDIFGSFW